MPSSLPAQVEDFITRYIDSLEELEVLLLLSASPEKRWTSQAVYEEIKSSPISVGRRLERLVFNKLLKKSQDGDEITYQFAPAEPGTAEAVAALAAAYKEKRLKVIEFLFSKPISALQSFSDAFKIRKDPTNG